MLIVWLGSLALFCLLLLFLMSRVRRPCNRLVYASERMCYDPQSDQYVAVKDELLDDRPDGQIIHLSVVIPAYNEEARLPSMVDECVAYMEQRRKVDQLQYEVILVDDGSADRTSALGHEWTCTLGMDRFRVVTLAKNRGKGGAVKEGIMRARGNFILFADADGATKFADLSDLERVAGSGKSLTELDGKMSVIVCGSRAHLKNKSLAERTLLRSILMFGFHVCVWLFGCRSIRDTQCGFKLMSRSAARATVPSLHLSGWAFDVELLKIAEMSPTMSLYEVPVHWTEIDGSKLSPAWAAVEMFHDLFMLWLKYALGWWQVQDYRAARVD